MLENALFMAGGCVLLVAAQAVLTMSPSLEVSLRTAAALLIAWAGALFIVAPLRTEDTTHMASAVLLTGASLWIVQAAWRRRGQPMRRATDWGELDDRPRSPAGAGS